MDCFLLQSWEPHSAPWAALPCVVKLHLLKTESKFVQSLLDYNTVFSVEGKKSLSTGSVHLMKCPLQTLPAFLRGIKLEKKCYASLKQKRPFPVEFAFLLAAYTIVGIICKPSGKGLVLKGCKNKRICRDSVLSSEFTGFVIDVLYIHCMLQ